VWVMSVALVLIALVISAAAAVGIGRLRWESVSRKTDHRLIDARLQIVSPRVVYEERDGLPDPVQRYFRAVIEEGRPSVAVARLSHSGCINMGDRRDDWKRFVSAQLVVTAPPGFHWKARISMVPGFHAYVRDAYIAETGILNASLLGLVTVAELGDTPELAQGELMRFLAEAAWYPTMLLPGNGVRWQAIDGTSARASLDDGANRATLDFGFDDEGLITTVRARERFRSVDGKFVPTGWHGKFSEYAWRDGMRIPLLGEVAWLLPDGPHPYWRGRVKSVSYE
jgi:hypothetical protein